MKVFANKFAVSVFARSTLQRQRNQVAKTAFRYKILIRKHTVVEAKHISCLTVMALVKSVFPNLRADIADSGSSKKTQTCAPFPDRERSIATGMSNSLQTERNTVMSFSHFSSSKSTVCTAAKQGKKQLYFFFRGAIFIN